MGSAGRRDYSKRKKDPRVVAGPSTRSELSHANRACVARTNVRARLSVSTGKSGTWGWARGTGPFPARVRAEAGKGAVRHAQAHFSTGGTVSGRSNFLSAALTGAALARKAFPSAIAFG